MRYLIIAVIAYHIIGAISWLFTEHKPAKTIAQIEREQRGILREQERQCREVERLAREQMREERERLKLAKEQEKQAAQIAKHESEIRVLKQSVKRMKNKYADLDLQLETLEEIKEMVMSDFLKADHSGDTTKKEKFMRKLVAIDKQISNARDSRDALADKIENAEIKIAS